MASVIVDARLCRSQSAPVSLEPLSGTERRPPILWRAPRIDSWSDLRIACRNRPLLARLDDYENSLLISGCHWPSTTAVTRLLQRTGGFADHGFGHDDELDGALLLAGYVTRFSPERHCFQTTYLNERFREYLDHEDFKLIWILREPRSVVSSLLTRWKRAALDGLWPGGEEYAGADSRSVLSGASRIDKACSAYAAAAAQALELHARLGERFAMVDYDDLATHRERLLPQLCELARTAFDRQLLSHLHGKHVHRGDTLVGWEAARVDDLAAPAYWRARALCAIGTGHVG